MSRDNGDDDCTTCRVEQTALLSESSAGTVESKALNESLNWNDQNKDGRIIKTIVLYLACVEGIADNILS